MVRFPSIYLLSWLGLAILHSSRFEIIAQQFVPAPKPTAARAASPLRPEAQRALFSVPPGFEVELVASEEQGVAKPVTVAWDDSGRMWIVTALEYPVDGNEQ